MVRAVATQLRHHVAPAYQSLPVHIGYINDDTEAQPGSWVVAVLDDSDQAGALGYHSETNDGVIYGKVFARPSLDNGSTAFTGTYAVSSVLSHEVLEIFGNPDVNKWAIPGQDSNGNPIAVAYELCDPVEDCTYPVVDHYTDIEVAVSDFVLPTWFDAQTTSKQVDYLGKLSQPLTITPGGYASVWENGQVQSVVGHDAPQWRTESKKHELARSHRISANERKIEGLHPSGEEETGALFFERIL